MIFCSRNRCRLQGSLCWTNTFVAHWNHLDWTDTRFFFSFFPPVCQSLSYVLCNAIDCLERWILLKVQIWIDIYVWCDQAKWGGTCKYIGFDIQSRKRQTFPLFPIILQSLRMLISLELINQFVGLQLNVALKIPSTVFIPLSAQGVYQSHYGWGLLKL